jgi:hypothetical protein
MVMAVSVRGSVSPWQRQSVAASVHGSVCLFSHWQTSGSHLPTFPLIILSCRLIRHSPLVYFANVIHKPSFKEMRLTHKLEIVDIKSWHRIMLSFSTSFPKMSGTS